MIQFIACTILLFLAGPLLVGIFFRWWYVSIPLVILAALGVFS